MSAMCFTSHWLLFKPVPQTGYLDALPVWAPSVLSSKPDSHLMRI